MLSLAQGQAIVSTLRKDTAAALARAQQVKADSEQGAIHGVLNYFDLTGDNSVDAVPGDLRTQLAAIDRMERAIPAAVEDPAKGDTWLDSTRYMQSNLRTYAAYQESSTVDAILAQTALATAVQAKDLASSGAAWVLSAIPWWGYAAGALALVAGFFVLRARARAVSA